MSNLCRVSILALPLMLLGACHEDGPAQQAGKSLDEISEKLHDAIDPPGPAQKLGRALDKATR
jgi:hypothetical protein